MVGWGLLIALSGIFKSILEIVLCFLYKMHTDYLGHDLYLRLLLFSVSHHIVVQCD